MTIQAVKENDQYYAEHLGVRYNVTKDLKDGKCTIEVLGKKINVEAEQEKKKSK